MEDSVWVKQEMTQKMNNHSEKKGLIFANTRSFCIFAETSLKNRRAHHLTTHLTRPSTSINLYYDPFNRFQDKRKSASLR